MTTNDEVVKLDGARGEGGGQILRSALALSAVTGKPFRITRIRAGRKKPGLLRQHLAAARAAAAICGAEIEGAEAGSSELSFVPGPVVAGDHCFRVGSAGSACLVFQTVLPLLLVAEGRSRVAFEGGTHNPSAPTFDFLARAFVPALLRMGAELRIELVRHGFYPAGGGRIEVTVEGGRPLRPLELVDPATPSGRLARVLSANLPDHVGQRELRELRRKLGWVDSEFLVQSVSSDGPGNLVSIELLGEEVSDVVTSFGAIGVKAEVVARRAVDMARRALTSAAPVGEHLADQLLLPLALAGGGRFRTVGVTPHCTTNAEVIERFLPVGIVFEGADDGTTTVAVSAR